MSTRRVAFSAVHSVDLEIDDRTEEVGSITVANASGGDIEITLEVEDKPTRTFTIPKGTFTRALPAKAFSVFGKAADGSAQGPGWRMSIRPA